MKKTAIFAGTFDPFTLGHYDLVLRASSIFERLIVVIAHNANKKTMYSIEDRLAIVSSAVKGLDNVEVLVSEGLLSDIIKREGVDVLVRGLRTALDFEYEKSLMEIYKQQCHGLECMYLISASRFSHISSTAVRELITFGGDLNGFVPTCAIKTLKQKATL